MEGNAEWTDGDVARTIAARTPGSAEAAESELYRRFAPRVRLYGLRHLRNDDAARDLAQRVLLVAIEKLRNGSVRDADQIASFILGMSRLVTKDLKRQEWRREKLREAFIPPFPGDDLVVTSLRGDFSGAPALTLSVTGLAPTRTVTDLPVSPSEGEVFFALPAALVRELPSTRIEITLRSVRDAAEIGRYVLDHTAPA
jgi:DNA-directed RNA polymerase specialized sigma24 family protein